MLKNDQIYISASLSCMDLLHAQREMTEIQNSSVFCLHYDVVDGLFNDCFVFGDLMLSKLRPLSDKPIAVHLAVQEIERYLKPMIQNGADYIAVHYETPCDHHRVFETIRALGAKPILAFRCDSAVPDDFEELAREVEWILKLTVHPGFAGQSFQLDALAHIQEMRRRLDAAGLPLSIEADGNINETTIPMAVRAGANMLTGGTSGLFRKDSSIEKQAGQMKRLAEECV